MTETIGDLNPVDVRAIARWAGASPAYGGRLRWTSGSEAAYQLWRLPGERVGVLVLWWSVNGQDLEITAQVVATPAHLGGLVWWALCPRCGRRCARLAITREADGLGCRVCLKLGYRSQIVGPLSRAADGCRAIRSRHGGPANLFDPWWDKPPRMHWARWDRIKEREESYRARALALALGSLGPGPADR